MPGPGEWWWNGRDAFLANLEAYSKIGIEKSWISIQGDDPVAFVEQVVSVLDGRFEQVGGS